MDIVGLVLSIILLFVIISFGSSVFTGAPYVPSFEKETRLALTKLYKITKKDCLIDLGSGDGKVLRVASELGAKMAVGVELNIFLVWFSRLRLYKYKNCYTVWDNIMRYEFPAETTVVYIFGDGRDIKTFARKVQRESTRLGRPLYLISHAFEVPGLNPEKKYRAYFLYRINKNTVLD